MRADKFFAGQSAPLALPLVVFWANLTEDIYAKRSVSF
jgi:hypothetical protein